MNVSQVAKYLIKSKLLDTNIEITRKDVSILLLINNDICKDYLISIMSEDKYRYIIKKTLLIQSGIIGNELFKDNNKMKELLIEIINFYEQKRQKPKLEDIKQIIEEIKLNILIIYFIYFIK